MRRVYIALLLQREVTQRVSLLKVNREGNVNLRGLLKLAGLHPPVFLQL